MPTVKNPVEVYEVEVTNDFLVVTFGVTKVAVEIHPDGMIHVYENYEKDTAPTKSIRASKKIMNAIEKRKRS